MKKQLLFCMLLISSIQIKSNPFENLIPKFILFYASQFTATLSHELGHALISNYRNFNPKIIIGKSEANYNKDDNFLQIDNSYDPSIGITLSKRFHDSEDMETKINKNILLLIMGPIFGVLSQIIQLVLIDYFQDKLNYNLANSLRDFIGAKIIRQFIYGFTPFDQLSNGDGAKLFNMLHIKYKFKTSFFGKAKSYQNSFSILKDSWFELMAGYYMFYFLSKMINKNDMLDRVENKFNNKAIHYICAYLKDREIQQQVSSFENDLDEKIKKEKINMKLDKFWIAHLVADCLIF